MIAIVNVTPNWGIGFENHLLISISADLRRFRALTEGKTVVLGRKTLETFPQQRPLPNRRNIIMSTNPSYGAEGAEVARNLPELFARLRKIPTEDICVIGGESIYRALLPYCDRALVTKTFADIPADRFFPNLNALPNWTQTAASEPMEEKGAVYQYIDYVNNNPLPMPSKALIWDLDGTLIDSYTVIVDCLEQAFAEQGVILEREEILREILTHSSQTLIDKIAANFDISLEQLYRRNAELNGLHASEVGLMPNAAEALERLSRNNLNFIYTHKGASTEAILENLGIRKYFAEVVNGLAGFPRKPAPDAILNLLNKYQLAPEDTFYIGDRSIDTECAKNAGIKSILYLAHPDIVTGTGDLTVWDLLEIEDVI